MKKSARYAPTRRELKRAAKSALPQHNALARPRTTPAEGCIAIRANASSALATRARPSLFADLSRRPLSRPDCAANRRDGRWATASYRENQNTAREIWKCPGWFATTFAWE